MLVGSVEFEFKPITDAFFASVDKVTQNLTSLGTSEDNVIKRGEKLEKTFSLAAKAAGVTGLAGGLALLGKRYKVLDKSQQFFSKASLVQSDVIKSLGKSVRDISKTYNKEFFTGLVKSTKAGATMSKKMAEVRASLLGVDKVLNSLRKPFALLTAGIFGIGPKAVKVVEAIELGGVAFAGLGAAAAGAGGTLDTMAAAFTGISKGALGLIGILGNLSNWIGNKMVSAGRNLRDSNNQVVASFAEWEQVQFAIKTAVEGYNKAIGISLATTEEYNDLVKKVSNTTGIARKEIANATLQLLEFSQVTGLSSDQTQRLIAASAEYALVTGQNFMTVITGIDNFFRGYKQTLQSVGIQLTDTDLAQTKYALNLKRSTSEMTTSQKAMAASEAMLHKMNFALGKSADFLETTYVGALQKVNTHLENMRISMGEGAVSVRKNFVSIQSAIVETVEKRIPEGFLVFVGAFKELMGVFLTFTGAIVQQVTQWGLLFGAIALGFPILKALIGYLRSMAAASALASASGAGGFLNTLLQGVTKGGGGLLVGARAGLGGLLVGTALMGGIAASKALSPRRSKETEEALNFSKILQRQLKEARNRSRVGSGEGISAPPEGSLFIPTLRFISLRKDPFKDPLPSFLRRFAPPTEPGPLSLETALSKGEGIISNAELESRRKKIADILSSGDSFTRRQEEKDIKLSDVETSRALGLLAKIHIVPPETELDLEEAKQVITDINQNVRDRILIEEALKKAIAERIDESDQELVDLKRQNVKKLTTQYVSLGIELGHLTRKYLEGADAAEAWKTGIAASRITLKDMREGLHSMIMELEKENRELSHTQDNLARLEAVRNSGGKVLDDEIEKLLAEAEALNVVNAKLREGQGIREELRDITGSRARALAVEKELRDVDLESFKAIAEAEKNLSATEADRFRIQVEHAANVKRAAIERRTELDVLRRAHETALNQRKKGFAGLSVEARRSFEEQLARYDKEKARIEENYRVRDEAEKASFDLAVHNAKQLQLELIEIGTTIEESFAGILTEALFGDLDMSPWEAFTNDMKSLWKATLKATIKDKLNWEGNVAKNIFKDEGGLIDIFSKAGDQIGDLFGGILGKKGGKTILSIEMTKPKAPPGVTVEPSVTTSEGQVIQVEPSQKAKSESFFSQAVGGLKNLGGLFGNLSGKSGTTDRGGFFQGLGNIASQVGPAMQGISGLASQTFGAVGQAGFLGPLLGLSSQKTINLGNAAGLGANLGNIAKFISNASFATTGPTIPLGEAFKTLLNVYKAGGSIGSGGAAIIPEAAEGAIAQAGSKLAAWTASLKSGIFAAIGSFIGSKVVGALVHQTQASQIGEMIGSFIGAAIGSFFGSVGAGLGAFIGDILGGLVGSLFGPTEWKQARRAMRKVINKQTEALFESGTLAKAILASPYLGTSVTENRLVDINSPFYAKTPEEGPETFEALLPGGFLGGKLGDLGPQAAFGAAGLAGIAAREIGGEYFGSKRSFAYLRALEQQVLAAGLSAEETRRYFAGLAQTLVKDLPEGIDSLNEAFRDDKYVQATIDTMETWDRSRVAARGYGDQLGLLVDAFSTLHPSMNGTAIVADLLADKFERVAAKALDFGFRNIAEDSRDDLEALRSRIEGLAEEIRSGSVPLEIAVDKFNTDLEKLKLDPTILEGLFEAGIFGSDLSGIPFEAFLLHLEEIEARLGDIKASADVAKGAFAGFASTPDFTQGVQVAFTSMAEGIRESITEGMMQAMITTGPLGAVMTDFFETFRQGMADAAGADNIFSPEEAVDLAARLKLEFADAVAEFETLTPVMKEIFDAIQSVGDVFSDILGSPNMRFFKDAANEIRELAALRDAQFIKADELRKSPEQFDIAVETARKRVQQIGEFLGRGQFEPITEEEMRRRMPGAAAGDIADSMADLLSKFKTGFALEETPEEELQRRLREMAETGVGSTADLLRDFREGNLGSQEGFASVEQQTEALKELVSSINSLYRAEADRIQGIADLRIDKLNDEMEVLQKVARDQARVSEKRIKALNDELEVVSRWVPVTQGIENIIDNLKDRLLFPRMTRGKRIDEISGEIAGLFSQLSQATDEDERARIAQKIVEAEERRLALAETFFQIPSQEFQKILRTTTAELERVRGIAVLGDEDRAFKLQDLIKKEQKRTADAAEKMSEQLDGINDEIYDINQEVKKQMEALGELYANVFDGLGEDLQEVFGERMDRLLDIFGEDQEGNILYGPLSAISDNTAFMKGVLERIEAFLRGEEAPTEGEEEAPAGGMRFISPPIDPPETVSSQNNYEISVAPNISITTSGEMTQDKLDRLTGNVIRQTEQSLRAGRMKAIVEGRIR